MPRVTYYGDTGVISEVNEDYKSVMVDCGGYMYAFGIVTLKWDAIDQEWNVIG